MRIDDAMEIHVVNLGVIFEVGNENIGHVVQVTGLVEGLLEKVDLNDNWRYRTRKRGILT